MRKIIRTLTLLTLAALFLGVSVPAYAQSTITFVDSLTAPDSGHANITRATPTFQKFTTGDYADGYTLKKIDVKGNNMQSNDGIQIIILNDASGVPGTGTLATFSNSSLTSTPGPASFSITYALTANTTYWIKFSTTRNDKDYKVGHSVSGYQEGLSAWSVGDNRLVLDSDNNYATHDRNIRIRLKGTVTNTPATGTLRISDDRTPQAGVKLDAWISSIEDANGKPDKSKFKYQWIRIVGSVETNIPGATSKAYRLQAVDAGATIKVTMTFTDKGGYDESFISAVFPSSGTIANTAPTAESGSVTAKEDIAYAFRVNDFNFMDADFNASLGGITVVSLPPTAKGSLTLDGVAVTAGQTVSARDINNDKLQYLAAPTHVFGDNYTSLTFKVNDGNADSADTYTLSINVASVNDAPLDESIGPQGSFWVGTTILSQKPFDHDGTTNAVYTYQWFRVSVDADGENTNEVRIPGATGESYKLTGRERGKRIKYQISYQDDDGHQETVNSSIFPIFETITNPPFHGLFSDHVTDEEKGKLRYYITLNLSERVFIPYKEFRDHGFDVTNGTVRGVKRLNRKYYWHDGRRRPFTSKWRVEVEPTNPADFVQVVLNPKECNERGALCDRSGRQLSGSTSIDIESGEATASTLKIAINDAPDVAEGVDDNGRETRMTFPVELTFSPQDIVVANFRITDEGTATPDVDYRHKSGEKTLIFTAGERKLDLEIGILDDSMDDDGETIVVEMVSAELVKRYPTRRIPITITDGNAMGTITNSDPLQTMWLSRFSRTVADHVVDAVTGRLSAPSGGSQVTLGGQSIDLSALSAGSGDARRTLAGALGAERTAEDADLLAGPGAWQSARAGSWEDRETGGDATSRTLTGRELLLGSSFHLAAGGGEAGGPGFAAWGRVTVGGFDAEAPAEKGTVRLDGEVTTGIVGADAQWERWLAGVALSVSEGEGKFDQPGVDSGTIESTLTSVNPYVRYEVSERVSAWGLLGYGTGDMTMTQAARGERAETVTRTDLAMRLGAVGARGALLEAGETGGLDLALRGDAFLVQMESAAAANTVETKADASRLRLVLEGSRAFALGEGAVLTPGLEVGLRHDGGDAETGTGIEVGGRIRYTDAGSGLTVEANARTLIAHEDSGYREWGAGGSVRLDPGASGRGLSLSLAPVWGTPSSGVDRLWSARDAAGLAPGGEFEATRRLNAELGYGLGVPRGLGLVTPYAGLSLAEGGGRTWRTGARWQVMPGLTLGLEGTRNETANDDEPLQHGLIFRGALRW